MAAQWLGKFTDAEPDGKAEEFFLSAGYPPELAKAWGPALSTITLTDQGDGNYLQKIETPSIGRVAELPFRLGEKRDMEGKGGINITALFEWDAAKRTLVSTFNQANGPKFNIDLVYSEDYNTVTKHRFTSSVDAKQKMTRT